MLRSVTGRLLLPLRKLCNARLCISVPCTSSSAACLVGAHGRLVSATEFPSSEVAASVAAALMVTGRPTVVLRATRSSHPKEWSCSSIAHCLVAYCWWAHWEACLRPLKRPPRVGPFDSGDRTWTTTRTVTRGKTPAPPIRSIRTSAKALWSLVFLHYEAAHPCSRAAAFGNRSRVRIRLAQPRSRAAVQPFQPSTIHETRATATARPGTARHECDAIDRTVLLHARCLPSHHTGRACPLQRMADTWFGPSGPLSRLCHTGR